MPRSCVQPGWRLIGYDLPVGNRLRYFAFVAPEPIHVHLGFEHGTWMADRTDLEGAHPSSRGPLPDVPAWEAIPEAMCLDLVRRPPGWRRCRPGRVGRWQSNGTGDAAAI
jgi:hypothetical protein